MDIIVLSKGYTKNDVAIHTLKNNFEADAYFVKVIGEYSDVAIHLVFLLPSLSSLSSLVLIFWYKCTLLCNACTTSRPGNELPRTSC